VEHIEDVLPRIADPSPVLLCRAVGADEDDAPLVRVPVTTVAWGEEIDTAEVFDKLPRLPAVEQLRVLVGDGFGLGLFAAAADDGLMPDDQEDDVEAQRLQGGILIFAPQDWDDEADALAEWFEGEGLPEDVPYGLDDVLVFARQNFGPDCWYLVLKGPLAGSVCFFCHDGPGSMHEPWAADIIAWGERVWDDVEEAFGGIVRFPGRTAEGGGVEAKELMPVRYDGGT